MKKKTNKSCTKHRKKDRLLHAKTTRWYFFFSFAVKKSTVLSTVTLYLTSADNTDDILDLWVAINLKNVNLHRLTRRLDLQILLPAISPCVRGIVGVLIKVLAPHPSLQQRESNTKAALGHLCHWSTEHTSRCLEFKWIKGCFMRMLIPSQRIAKTLFH